MRVLVLTDPSLRGGPWCMAGKYLSFQKSHFSLTSVGSFHPISLSFPFLSDFSLCQRRHTKCHLEVISAQPAHFFQVPGRLSFAEGLLGEFVILSYPSAFCFPQAYLCSVRNEGTEFGTTLSNFQGKTLWRTASHSS